MTLNEFNITVKTIIKLENNMASIVLINYFE